MIAVVVEIEVDPGRVEEFVGIARANAAGSRNEPGCRQFEVIQHLDEPHRFVLYEKYDDLAAIEAHYATAHFQAWREATAPERGIVRSKHGVRFAVVG